MCAVGVTRSRILRPRITKTPIDRDATVWNA